ncbi:MAG: hypothetical protein OEZ58_09420 [Gammaproteobacteria bacterium]|nr:hypothetical protein [Gammaproteobacteria bacterium]MDH5729197.1 hypothetical protein [Gammaproteobacteria bacterium]
MYAETSQTTIMQHTLHQLELCKNNLYQLQQSCCMAERSQSMQKLLVVFHQCENTLNIRSDVSQLNQVEEQLMQIGAQLGQLHVSCCTSTREKIYQKLLHGLNKIYLNLQVLLGRDSH